VKKLSDNKIPHYEFSEPDYDYGFTSIATIPLRDEQRQVLRNYRLYKACCHSSKSTERPVETDREVSGSTPGGSSILPSNSNVESCL
jgi:hypothetical protein